MDEKAEVAVVAVVFIEGKREDGGEIQVQGTSVTWATEDVGAARTLKEQLCGLLGDPAGEGILPWVAADAARNFRSPWPGAVSLGRENDDG